MKKLCRLIWVMNKCGRSGKADNGAKRAVRDWSSYIIGAAVLVLGAFMFFAGRYMVEHQVIFGEGETIFRTIMMLGAMASMFLSIPYMVSQLYMSGDLDVLVTMPFTPMQIVAAKLVNAAAMPLAICCGLIIPTGFGYGLAAGITSVMYWIGLFLSSVLLSVTASSMAGLIVILIMRLFRRIRSRNVIAVITALFTFGIGIAYILLSGTETLFNAERLTSIFQVIDGSMGGVAKAIPMIGFSAKAMFVEGAWYQMLFAIVAAAVPVVLLLLAAKYLYFEVALGMQDSNSARSSLSEAQLAKSTHASSVRHAMLKREVVSVMRIPSMITNGFLQSFILPLVVCIPLGMNTLKGVPVDAIKEIASVIPAGLILIFLEALTAIMVSMGVGMSSISSSCISREGKDYYTLKAMPVSMRTIVAVKHRVAVLFNCIPAVGYPVLFAVVCSVMGILPMWSIAVVLAFGIPFMSLLISFCCMGDVKNPNLNWENEADVCKNNSRGMIMFLVLFFGSGALIFVAMQFAASDLAIMMLAAAILILNLVGAILCYQNLMKAADELPKCV